MNKDGVTVNIDSKKAINTVVGHEITHVLEGTEFYAELQKLVILNATETAEISDFANHSTENSHQWLDVNGWDERTSYVMTKDGTIYPVTLHIAKAKDGRNILYDVNVKIKEGVAIDKIATSSLAEELTKQAVKVATPSDAGSLTQDGENVKTQFSLTKDTDGRKLSNATQKRFANSNELARQVIESLGYDGIIDPTVFHKWNMDMEEGTTHYIVFKPNQIKAVTNQNPTDNPDIHRSLSAEGEAPKTYGNYNIFGKEIAYKPEQTAAPVQEVAPVREDITTEESSAVGYKIEPTVSKMEQVAFSVFGR